MSSFTWSAMIFPESNATEPLFNWYSNWPECEYRSSGIRFNENQQLRFGVCSGSAMSFMTYSETVMSVNQWHEVAVSFNETTGEAHMCIDGDVYS